MFRMKYVLIKTTLSKNANSNWYIKYFETIHWHFKKVEMLQTKKLFYVVNVND